MFPSKSLFLVERRFEAVEEEQFTPFQASTVPGVCRRAQVCGKAAGQFLSHLYVKQEISPSNLIFFGKLLRHFFDGSHVVVA